MSKFLTRAVTGLAFAAALIGCIYWNQWSFGGLFLLITVLGTLEFYRLSKKMKAQPRALIGAVVAGLLFVFSFCLASGIAEGKHFLGLALILIFGLFLVELFSKSKHPYLNIAFTSLGWIYIVVPFALLPFLGFFRSDVRTEDYSPEILLGYLFCLWLNDTGAYMVGSQIGRTKLFERVSPNKTWEGTIGGLVFGVGVAVLCSYLFDVLSFSEWLGLGIITVITGSLGDLVESRLKRSIGVKDSGNLLPGHGGILDRFDAVLGSAPFVAAYLGWLPS
ncbi:MAG: phosphatidate cytidylyltransferase [Salibacteraceae bacterium]